VVYRCNQTTSGNFCNHECDYALSRRVFIDGDETKLKPMILKDIADLVGLDISTISRVEIASTLRNSYGTKNQRVLLRSDENDQGEDVSTLEIKKSSQNIIEEEDKKKPLPDDQLAELLKEKKSIARRTIAKYRATGYSG
jgi:RNA polymerase sigma-54 factor